ncbi:TRAP transporter large permease [Sporosarcina sp. FSL W8-0480]|uniref:TRAP transporter large permease n=1 Tax=Sporosarcina sp. FSL W8-0480 TaxID=2954701 RepID=UPI0030DA6E7C
MEIYIGIVLLFLFLALGVPVFLSMAMAGAIGLLFVADFNTLLGIFSTNSYTSVAHYSFLSIPLFILMANFLTTSNITKDLFWVAQKWIGRLPGGLAIATVLAGAGLGALSGTSTASAATLAGAAVPEMNKHGYSTRLSMGVVSMSGTLAIMIPPSGTLIIFGLISGYSITELFRAAIIPGILTTIVYIIVVLIWVKKRPGDAPRLNEKVPFMEKLASLKDLWPILLLLVIVILSIFSGWVTITEAAGVAALGSFLIPLFMKRLSFQKVFVALQNTIKTTTMIFAIIVGAMVFGYYLTLTQITRKLVVFISELDMAAIYIVLIFVLLYAFLGLFMDQVAILYLTLPLAIPVVEALGVDVIWFAILIVAAAETGLVTPPLGLNCYVASGTAGESLEETFKGVMPFVAAQFGVILILFLFPWLTSIL